MRKATIILLATLYSLFSYCQTWENTSYDKIVRLIELHKFDKAYKKLDNVFSQIGNKSDIEYLEFLTLYGYAYIQDKDYTSALSKLEEAMGIIYEQQIYDSKIHLKTAYLMSDAYFHMGKYKETESIINIALVRCTRHWQDCIYAKKMYFLLTEVYKIQNASQYIIDQIQRESQNISNNTSVLYSNKESKSYNNKEVLLEAAQEDSINNLVYTAAIKSLEYANNNKYDISVRILDEAETKLERSGQINHSSIRILHANRGKLYLGISDVTKAKRYLLLAKDLFEKNNDLSLSYWDCINSLAVVFQEEGLYFYSTILLHCSKQNIESIIQKSKNLDLYPAYLSAYDNLARNYYQMGDLHQAMDTWERISELALKENCIDAAYSSIVNLVYAQMKLGEYKKGIEKLHNMMKYDYGFMKKEAGYQILLMLLYFSDDKDIMKTLYEYISFSKSNITTILSSYSEEERDTYWANQSLVLEMITNAICWKNHSPEAIETAYDMAVYTKYLSIKLPKLLNKYIRNNSSPLVKSDYEKLKQYKEICKKTSTHKDSTEIYSKMIAQLERQILSTIKSPSNLLNGVETNFQTIKNKLSPNEAAIEFVIIPEIISADSAVEYYGALIARTEYDCPKIVKLCERETLESYLEVKNINDIYDIGNSTLYKYIIGPMDSLFNKGDSLYFSPVGVIHKINLEALCHNGRRLMDYYKLYHITSTAILVDTKTDKSYDDAYVVGGIDYNADNGYVKQDSSLCEIAYRDKSRSQWDEIQGTLYEAIYIDSLLKEKAISSRILMRDKATEESFKQLDGKSPSIIHVATHGFFYSNSHKLPSFFFPKIRDDNMRRNQSMRYSGLLFAGANRAWSMNLEQVINEDGILTAEEISLLDLSKTKLAVLSACNTALGEIDDIDGVYGLQRAFKISGVETIMMSLWEVSDEATRILMVEFYKNLMSGKTKHQSLKDAQQYLRKAENGKYDEPKYWASFIMLDGLN